MPREPIRLIEGKISAQAEEARQLLHTLEEAMLACGYVRTAVYNSGTASFTSHRQRTTVLVWGPGIRLVASKEKWLKIDEMSVEQLLTVANHLAPFLDALEDGSRHMLNELELACQKVQRAVDSVQESQQPDKAAEG